MTCPHCAQITQDGERCVSCKGILPVAESQSHYEVLGYSAEILNLSSEDLEQRFLTLNKKFHPDRFGGKSTVEQEIAHNRSAAVNNAYRTLKDPVARAKYVVERNLGSIEEKSAQVPMEMAEYFFEIQDLLESLHGEETVREIRKAEHSLNAKIAGLEEEMQECFLRYDESFEASVLEDIKRIFSERAYIKSFLREINKKVEG